MTEEQTTQQREARAWKDLEQVLPALLKNSDFSAIDQFVRGLLRRVQELEQTQQYWTWLKEQKADLLYFETLGAYRVFWPSRRPGRTLFALRPTPEEAVQAAMDGIEE